MNLNGGGNPPTGNHIPLPDTMALALGFPAAGPVVLGPDRFEYNRAVIEDMKRKLEAVEQQNWAGLANYQVVMKLKEEADRGRRAQEALAALERGQIPSLNNGQTNAPGPSAPVQPTASAYAAPFRPSNAYIYPPSAYARPASPPQARIEEVSSPYPSSRPSSSSTAQYGSSQSFSQTQNSYVPQPNANSSAYVPQHQSWQGQGQESTYTTVNPRALQFNHYQNGQSSRSEYPGQNTYERRSTNDATPVQASQRFEQGRSIVSQSAGSMQNNLQPEQREQMQHPRTNQARNIIIPSATASQHLEVYNRYSTSSTLANALVSPAVDRPSSVGVPATNPPEGRPQVAGGSSNQYSGTNTRQTNSGASQNSSLAPRLEQQPSSGKPQEHHIGMNAKGPLEQPQNNQIQVPNTLKSRSQPAPSQPSTMQQNGKASNIPINVANDSTSYVAGASMTESRGTNIVNYNTQAWGVGIPPQPMRPSEPTSNVPHPTTFASNFVAFDPHSQLQARVPSGISVPTSGTGHTGTSNLSNVHAHGTVTPTRVNERPTPLTPASANKRSLAKSILRALGPPSSKRKADDLQSPSSTSMTIASSDEPPSKRQTIERPNPDLADSDRQQLIIEEVAQEERIVTDGSQINAASASPNLGAAIVDPETTEQDVRDLMDAFSHAVPDIPPMESVVRPPSTTPDVTEHIKELSIIQTVDEVSSVDTRTATPVTIPPGIASPTTRTRDDSVLDSAFALFEETEPPLFLPSPELLSSAGPSMNITDISELMKPSSSNLMLEERFLGPNPELRVYVEVPTVESWLRKRSKRSVKGKERETAPLPVMITTENKKPRQNTAMEGHLPTSEDEHRQQLAQSAFEVASSRLRSRPCLWKECSVVLNSADKLRIHVAEHVDTASKYTDGTIFPCRWKECIRRFNRPEVLVQHLQNHVRKYILCSYEGCEEEFDRPMRLLTHTEEKHMNDKLRPSAEPSQCIPLSHIPPMPPKMYTYRTVDLPVFQARISSERRNRLGPWVFKRIFGPVNFDRTRQSGRYLMRPKGDGALDKAFHTSYRKDDRRDRFDFLLRETPHNVNCDDLDSGHISELVERGLAFLPDKDGPQGPQEELLLSSLAQIESTGGKQEEELSTAAPMPSTQPTQLPESSASRNEQEASQPIPGTNLSSHENITERDTATSIPGVSQPVSEIEQQSHENITERDAATGLLDHEAAAADVQHLQPQLVHEQHEVVDSSIANAQPPDQEQHTALLHPDPASDSAVNVIQVANDPAPKPQLDLPVIVTLDSEVTATEALKTDSEVLKSASVAGEEDTVEDLV